MNITERTQNALNKVSVWNGVFKWDGHVDNNTILIDFNEIKLIDVESVDLNSLDGVTLRRSNVSISELTGSGYCSVEGMEAFRYGTVQTYRTDVRVSGLRMGISVPGKSHKGIDWEYPIVLRDDDGILLIDIDYFFKVYKGGGNLRI